MTSLTLDGPRWLTRVVAVAEPALASAVILNAADCRPIWMNEPFLSDFVSNFRVTPSVCSIVILASATGFPCASTTVPVIMPCAAAGRVKPRTTKLTRAKCHANRLENRRVIADPPEELLELPHHEPSSTNPAPDTATSRST